MNVARVVLVATLVPATVLLERFGYYLTRSMLSVHLVNLGMDRATMGQLFAFQAIAAAGFALLGGLLAVAIGPAATLALGMGVALVGHALLAASSSSVVVWVAAGAFGLGLGLLRPSTYALAASELRHPNEHLRNAAFVGIYAAANAAGLVAPAAGGALAGASGARAAFGAGAAVAAVGLLASIGLGLGWLFTRRKVEGDAPPSPALGKLLAGAGLLLAIGVIFTLHIGFGSDAQFSALRTAGTPIAQYSLALGVNPATVLITGLVAIVACVVLHFTRVRLTALFAVALGACLGGAATLPLLVGGPGIAGVYAFAALTGVAEVLVLPFALSRFSGDFPARWVPLLLGAWVAFTGGAALLGNALGGWLHGSERLLVAVSAAFVFLLGGGLIFAAAPLARSLYAPPQGET